MTLAYNGSRSNSFDSLYNDKTSTVSITVTPSGTGVNATAPKYTHLACEIANMFGLVRFKFDQPIQDNVKYTIAYTLYFYKE